MSSASAPNPSIAGAPVAPPPPRPAVVHPRPGKPSKAGMWLSAALLVALAIGVGLYLNARRGAGGPTRTGGTAIRTVPVGFGLLQHTVRVTGVVQAERFAPMMVPRLRGSFSGRGRGGMTGNANTSVAQVNTGSLGSSGVSSTTSGSGSGASGGSSVPSLGGSDSSGSTASGSSSSSSSSATSAKSSLGPMRGTTNRFSDRTATRPSTNRSTTSNIGNADLGTTSSGLMTGGGGGGGGGRDFSLVLLKVADSGGRVKKGDVVAEFDRQYQLLRLDDYRASVVQLDANITKLKADLAVARKAHEQLVQVRKADLDKARLDLKTREVRSAIDAERLRLFEEEATAAYKQVLAEVELFDESQRAQLRAAEIDRDQAKIELQRATSNVDRMLMKTPIDGIVVMQSLWRGGEMGQIREGDQVYPGMNFMSIVDPSSMVVNANVNQADSELLRLGMKARVRLDAYSDVELPATVVGIGAMTKPGGFRASYVREIPVRLKLDAMDPRVIPDLTASADIVLAMEPNVALAPREGVFREAGGGQPFVYLQGPSGWIRREVDLGLETNAVAAVRAGLRKGDVIAAQRPPT